MGEMGAREMSKAESHPGSICNPTERPYPRNKRSQAKRPSSRSIECEPDNEWRERESHPNSNPEQLGFFKVHLLTPVNIKAHSSWFMRCQSESV
jgi:hypothetical protein